MKSPCSFLGCVIQFVFSGLGRSKSKIIPGFPFMKIYFNNLIEITIASELGFKRDCIWRRARDTTETPKGNPSVDASAERSNPPPFSTTKKGYQVGTLSRGGGRGIRSATLFNKRLKICLAYSFLTRGCLTCLNYAFALAITPVWQTVGVHCLSATIRPYLKLISCRYPPVRIPRNLNNKKRLYKSIAFFRGGGRGIRTPVGLHPNGFQDRLVMTTSIALRIFKIKLLANYTA